MSKKAMKLALKALEVATTPFARDRQEVLRAQAALREALAEQPAQQEPFGYFKAEPFGWCDCAETDEGAIALYKRPPEQRKPLTDEQILDCWKQAYEPGRREHDNAARMARAIEAAHGIGEKK